MSWKYKSRSTLSFAVVYVRSITFNPERKRTPIYVCCMNHCSGDGLLTLMSKRRPAMQQQHRMRAIRGTRVPNMCARQIRRDYRSFLYHHHYMARTKTRSLSLSHCRHFEGSFVREPPELYVDDLFMQSLTTCTWKLGLTWFKDGLSRLNDCLFFFRSLR